ncbi:hypothetical protein SAMN05192558_11192 [Actinokineospora alba]|uniref:Integral membrane protein n=1 Tax=Actinokineospora alba TaxID=504798 RepID=A0A1H0UD98_9PSEU|nr:hypothetical protein [Actinokineospora alba]TDP65188.1 hypothetical protein C8E96_0667 [Actinokineospora alba]SDH56233.1 hypothetical protein SAMN05421871_101489 [Actinokineospora alba]SDP63985.1 hypothetical protein SAMN05192558_11192 [Actinokineospora alba]
MRIASDAPRTILGAGLLVALQGLTGLVFAVILLIHAAGGGSTPGNNVYGEAAYFTVLAGGVAAVGVGLLLGKHWARGPAIVVQLLLLGVAWYVFGPSGRPEFGVPFGLLVIGTLVLLFHNQSSVWAQGDDEAQS